MTNPTSKPIPQTYSSERYQEEKRLGIRRNSGANLLRRVKLKHKRIIELYLEGYENQEIAEQMGMSASWISVILNDPKIKKVIAAVIDDKRAQVDLLDSMAIDTIKQSMRSGQKISTRLAGVDRLVKLKSIEHESNVSQTAEDIIQAVMKKAEALAGQNSSQDSHMESGDINNNNDNNVVTIQNEVDDDGNRDGV